MISLLNTSTTRIHIRAAILWTFVIVIKDEGTMSYYEVKLQKFIWEKELAYILILKDIKDNQMLTVLKLSDKQKDKALTTLLHKLKSPINGILGLLDVLKYQVHDENCKRFLDRCYNYSKLLLYLVNSLLDLSKFRKNSSSLDKSLISLDHLIRWIKSLYKFMCKSKWIQFTVEKAEGITDHIHTNKTKLIFWLVKSVWFSWNSTFCGIERIVNCQGTRIKPRNSQHCRALLSHRQVRRMRLLVVDNSPSNLLVACWRKSKDRWALWIYTARHKSTKATKQNVSDRLWKQN